MGIVRIALLSSAALCMGTISSQANAQEALKTYNLPEQDLASALRNVARGSDYQLVADAKSLKGARAPSLAGAYTVEEAVAALLAPSGLTAEVRDRTITLRRMSSYRSQARAFAAQSQHRPSFRLRARRSANLVIPTLAPLFMTGYAETAALCGQDIEQGIAVLTKPFAVDALTARIHEPIMDWPRQVRSPVAW